MNCRTVRKRLALHAGGDLKPVMARRVEAHLQACEACRQEFALYKQSLQQTRDWFDQAEPSWTEGAWRRAVGHAVTSRPRPALAGRSLLYRPAWAYAAMALMAAALTFLVVRPLPESDTLGGPLAAAASASPSQDIVTLTLVSQESGLKVQWFLNRNFKLKEKSE
ncbi:MAG: zf-HC2 domain-containing protein [Candidatus Aminicenantaceae bacterium]